jgi:hypothetical protein
MATRPPRSRSRRATLENLLLVWLSAAIGPGFVVVLSWLGHG